MSFGICYEFEDLSAMAGTLNAGSLPASLRNEARRFWNGGLNQWDASPAGVFPGSNPALCPLCHIVTCSYGTLAQFIALLRAIANDFRSRGTSNEATEYMLALANDLSTAPGVGQNDAGREPYP